MCVEVNSEIKLILEVEKLLFEYAIMPVVMTTL